jgi:hypothetical protein
VVDSAHVERESYRDSTQRMGVGMNELLRDRARPRWLRRTGGPPR